MAEEHWEGNTIVDNRAGKETDILTKIIVIYGIKVYGG